MSFQSSVLTSADISPLLIPSGPSMVCLPSPPCSYHSYCLITLSYISIRVLVVVFQVPIFMAMHCFSSTISEMLLIFKEMSGRVLHLYRLIYGAPERVIGGSSKLGQIAWSHCVDVLFRAIITLCLYGFDVHRIACIVYAPF